MYVDEARGNGHAARVDLFAPAATQRLSDRGDERACHRDIELAAVRARPVEDSAAPDHDVVIRTPRKNRRRSGDCHQRRRKIPSCLHRDREATGGAANSRFPL
jgi:hypothetical protein